MEQQLFLTTLIVSFGFVSVQVRSQVSTEAEASKKDGESRTQVNLPNLLVSFLKNEMKNAETYRTILEEEAGQERRAFDAVKGEFRFARQRNARKHKNLRNGYGSNMNEKGPTIKREVSDQINSKDPKKSSHFSPSDPTYADWEKRDSDPPTRTRTELEEDLELKMGYLLSKGIKLANETLEECYAILNGTYDHERTGKKSQHAKKN